MFWYSCGPTVYDASHMGHARYCSVPENIHTPLMEGFFCTPLPPGNSRLGSYFPSKILAFKTPLPFGISIDLPWGGYGFFVELYIVDLITIDNFVCMEVQF